MKMWFSKWSQMRVREARERPAYNAQTPGKCWSSADVVESDKSRFQHFSKFESWKFANFKFARTRMKANSFPFSRVLEKASFSFHFTEFPFPKKKWKRKKLWIFPFYRISILSGFHCTSTRNTPWSSCTPRTGPCIFGNDLCLTVSEINFEIGKWQRIL
mgnify:CR=1 FL=1